MMNPFDPFDPFDPGSPFCDPYDPFLDPLHPFNDQPGNMSDPMATGNMIQDPFPYHDVGFDTMSGIPFPDELFPDTMASDIEPLEPSFGLDKPTGFEPTGLEGLDGDFDSTPESLIGLDARDTRDTGEDFGPESYDILDKLEESIEQEEPYKRGPENKSDLSDESQYWSRAFGMPSPDPKIEHKPEKRYERKFPLRLWKPRRHSGLKSSFISKASGRKHRAGNTQDTTHKQKMRYCPARNGEAVPVSECESCEFFRDGECTWSPEEDAEPEDREN